MEIRIELDGTRPPRGRTLGGRAVHVFGGWLELIRALEELVAGGSPNGEADPAEEGRSREGVDERVERSEDQMNRMPRTGHSGGSGNRT